MEEGSCDNISTLLSRLIIIGLVDGMSRTLTSQLASNSSTSEITISSVVSNSETGRLGAIDIYRRYAGSLTSSFQLDGAPDEDRKRCMYQIGVRTLNKRQMLRPVLDEQLLIDQSLNFGELIPAELVSICKRFSPITPVFNVMDLSAIAFQLARGIAVYVSTGNIDCAELRAGAALRIRSLALNDVPLRPSEGHVLISRNVDEYVGGTFAVLTACANAFRSVVYTDVLNVDANNAPVIFEPVGAACAIACWAGLQILLSMYQAKDEGTTIAYAITLGLHSINTVVAHSDEGGYMRDVIRRLGFRRPHGGILSNFVNDYSGLPAPTVTSESTFVGLVDSILLSTAGLFAVSDPLVVVEDRAYPTIFTDTSLDIVIPGFNQILQDPDLTAARLARQIALNAGKFCPLYIKHLGMLFHTTGGLKSSNMMIAQFQHIPEGPNRHLSFSTVAPYYWVEPTTLFKTKFDTPANNHGYGVLAGTHTETVNPMFEQYTITQDFGMCYVAAISHRSMRTNAITVALAGHQLDGLANIVPIQFSADKATLKGGDNTFAAARTAGDDLGMYNWVAQQCAIPHPAAFVYTGAMIGVKIVSQIFDEATLTIERGHVPSKTDITGDVIFYANKPNRINNAPLGEHGRAARRSRDVANNALTNARVLRRNGDATGGEIIAIGDFEPTVHLDRSTVNIGGGEAERGQGYEVLEEIRRIGRVLEDVKVAMPGRFQPIRHNRNPVVGEVGAMVLDYINDGNDNINEAGAQNANGININENNGIVMRQGGGVNNMINPPPAAP